MAIRKRRWIAKNGVSKQAWLVEYRDGAGKRRFKQFTLKKQAEMFEVKAKGEVVAGTHTAESQSVTISEAADIWLANVEALGREPTTYAAYEQHVRLHIVPKCGAVKLAQLTAPLVRSILDEWLKELSRPMTVRVLRSLKAILTTAQERGLVAQNVALAVKLPKQARESSPTIVLPKSVLRFILEAVGKLAHPRAHALLRLALFSALRASELRGLVWSALDLEKRTVTVYQRADAKGKIGAPKSKAGFRKIPLPLSAITALIEWKKVCPSSELDLVFPNKTGRPLSHRIMIKHLVTPFVPDGMSIGMHGFRHAAASLWIERGLNPKRIQYLMGHSSIQMTFDTYGHLFKISDQDADAMEAALYAE